MTDATNGSKLNENKIQLQQRTQEISQIESSQGTTAEPPWWTVSSAMTMSSVVLVFGLVVIVICAVLMRNSKPSAEAVLRVFGTVLIITGALFLVVAGYDDKQMAPVMGLLGTLAGYLLGKGPAADEGATAERERK